MEQGTSADGAVTAPAQAKLCECGCGQPAPIAQVTITQRGIVRGQSLRFVAGHNGKGVPRTRLPEITQMVKLCECGCGEPAPIATRNRPEVGHVKGRPIRFIRGHSREEAVQRLRLRPGQEMQFVGLCECGCGCPTPIAANSYAPYGAVKGQPVRFVLGHRIRAEGPGGKVKLSVDAGQRFGAGVVVDPETRYVTRSGKSYRGARLLCDCGTEFVRMIGRLLRSPGTQSCGGCAGVGDLTGRRFGRLTAVQWIPGGTATGGGSRWLCRCDCETEVTHLSSELAGGRAKSCGCGRSGPRNGPAFRSSLNKYQANAQNRGLFWGLADDDFLRLTSMDCHYCGAAPATAAGTFIYNGLDRVNNALGYFLSPAPGNVVPCCGTCNHAKGTMSYEDFLAWIARLASFHFFRPDMTPPSLLKARA